MVTIILIMLKFNCSVFFSFSFCLSPFLLHIWRISVFRTNNPYVQLSFTEKRNSSAKLTTLSNTQFFFIPYRAILEDGNISCTSSEAESLWGGHESFLLFPVLSAASIKITAFWDTALCSLVEVDRRFRSAYCLHHQDDDWGSTYLWNVVLRQDYTSLYPRRLSYLRNSLPFMTLGCFR
jgi:hypothetical protein